MQFYGKHPIVLSYFPDTYNTVLRIYSMKNNLTLQILGISLSHLTKKDIEKPEIRKKILSEYHCILLHAKDIGKKSSFKLLCFRCMVHYHEPYGHYNTFCLEGIDYD